MTWAAGLLIIALAVYAVSRQLDVRLVLTAAGFGLGCLAGDPVAIVRTFLVTFSNERFVVPICTAMGFASVLRLTECDQHLVHLLTRPLEYARSLVVPGAVVVGFLVNIPVISQTSTAVAIGAVLVPLLRAARVPAVTTGAALLLGSSMGGELLNPGAPELNTIADALKIKSGDCVAHVYPLLMLQLPVATGVFWLLSLRRDGRPMPEKKEDCEEKEAKPEAPFRVNLVKAAVPLIPVTLLFVTGPPLRLLPVPEHWLVPQPGARASRAG